MTESMFLIEKRGLYYCPEARGYTGLKRAAGRYTFEDAAERVGPNGPDGPQDGLGIWREEDAPEFSSACAWDVKLIETARAKATAEERAAVVEMFHPEQVRIWAQEIAEALAMHDHLDPETYDDVVEISHIIQGEIEGIADAIRGRGK